jgi:hypothetical protein
MTIVQKSMNRKSVLVVILMMTIATTLAYSFSLSVQSTYAAIEDGAQISKKAAAPIATSGDNVYVAWWTNKTGNDEVMFKASTDNGKTFGDKMNLSNTINSNSQDAQISASASNVYVSWWERNATSNEPVMRVSNDNGKTFGDLIMLSSNTTSGATQ